MGISRRAFLHGLAAGAGAFALGPGILRAATGRRKPNFIVIFTDDQGYQDLGCFGSPDIRTPHIDRMATEGMKFTDFYVAAPVCSPSRAALLTGCYPARIGFTFGALYPGISRGLNPKEITIADLLKREGYATTCIGKWHVGGPHKPYMPTSRGFDSFFGMIASNDYRKAPLYRGLEVIEKKPDQSQLTQRYTQEAIQFIKANREKPFFLYLPHTMPHVPLSASEKFAGKSKRGPYGDAIEEIDWSTGEILKTLKELGLDEDTLVIFTSDNGPWTSKGKDGGSAAPWVGGKFKPTEGGHRVPCVMRWPGTIPAGRTCEEFVSNAVDLPSTFCEAAGAPIPDTFSGVSLLGSACGTGGTCRQDIFSSYHGNQFGAFTQRMVRDRRWKYVWNATDTDELYDLDSDPGELVNRLRDPACAAELQRLRGRMVAWMKEIGDPMCNRWTASTIEEGRQVWG